MGWTKFKALRLALASIVGLTCAVFAGPAVAEKRVALVVGNSTYQYVARLDNPRNDAKLMADTLQGLGFQLIGGGPQVDLDKQAFDAALQKFGNAVVGADVALFYYAGHGVQVAGKNFLVPVAANPTKEADVYLQMVDSAIVLDQMDGAGTRLNIVLLDACRNNPFGGRGLRATGGGLAQMQAPGGTLISYATQPGNVAQDGDDGHSPYTKALTAAMRKPGLGLFETFNEVGLAVQGSTGGTQQPWLSSSPIAARFYFSDSPQNSATDALKLGETRTGNISGAWNGTYYYMDPKQKQQLPVNFIFSFDTISCSGRSEELNTFNKNSRKLFANLSCSEAGLHAGQIITIKKTYDGTGGVSHSVIYTGTVSPDLHTISGQWAINDTKGTFTMSR
jgi:hypothetical protein